MLQQPVDPKSVVREAPLQLSIVVPTRNESGNVEPLLKRLGVALAGIEWEAIFVDDNSTDGTPELLTKIAQADRRVRLIRRMGRRGLSSAVVEGALASTTPIVAVIDADLQHDEKILPDLYRAIANDGQMMRPMFIKEIKKLSGASPKELFKNENRRFLQFLISDKK